MAKFGSYNNSSSPYMSWYAEYSYSRTSNSSVSVTVTVYGEILNHSASSWMGTGNGITVSATVGGTTKTAEIKSSSNVWQGNTNNPRSCSFSFNVSSGAAGQSISVSYSVTGSGYTAAATVPTQSTSFSSPALLYTASSLFTSSIVDNVYTDTVYATITRQNSSMTHKLVYTCNGHSVTHTNVGTSDSLTIPPELVTDSVSAIVYVSCETFYGGASVGTSSDYAKILVTTSAVPSITSKAYEIVDGKFGLCVAGYSKIKWAATAAGASGSTIIESNVTGGGYTVALDGTTGILYDSGDITFTIWARDSRGRTCNTTQVVSVQAYAKPTVSVTGTQRCLQDGTIDDDGTYLRCMGTATYDTVGDKNTCSYKLSYRKLGETTWSASYDWTPGTATVIGGGNINPDVAYEVRYQATDQLSAAYYVDQVPNKKYLIDAYEDDNGVQSLGFGGAAKEDGKATFYMPIVQGDYEQPYIVDAGHKENADSNWDYIKWSNGIAECWGTRWVGTIQSSEFADWGNVVYYTVPESTFPFAFASEPAVINTVENDGASAWCAQYAPSATKTGKTGVVRPYAATVNNIKVIYHAVGRWK